MEEKGILAVFLVPIMCVILLGIVWSTVQTATTIQTVTNESFTAVNDTHVALTYDGWVACSAVRNVNDTTLGTGNYSVGLSGGTINITTAGLAVDNGSGFTHYADYTYKDDSYMESSMSRTVIGYLPIIFALAMLVFIAGFIVLKKRAE